MNRALKIGLASVLTVASLATMSVPAQARDWNGGGYRGGDHDGAGAAIAGGVIGLALGAAIASSNHDDGYRSNGYGSGYYGSNHGYTPGYEPSGYGYGERQCVVRRRVWDGYDGRYEARRVSVPC